MVERASILFPRQTISAEQVEIILHRRGRVSNAERSALWEATEKAVSVMAEPQPVIETETVVAPAPAEAESNAIGEAPVDRRKMMADLEYRYIAEALRASEGVVADAARLLSLQRTTLIEKMRKYGISRAA